MDWIDRFAYGNQLRKLDPVYKAGFSLITIVICLLVNHPAFSLTALVILLLLSLFLAKLPVGFVSELLFVEGSFLLFSIAGIAISIYTNPYAGGTGIGRFYLLLTQDSIFIAVNLLMRSLACVSAMNFLALTTPLVDLIELFHRIHIPELLIDLMTLMYRFIFTLLDCFNRMVIAVEARSGFRTWSTSMNNSALIAANLFIESYRKSQHLEKTLEARCWSEHLQVLPQTYEGFTWLIHQFKPAKDE